LQPFWGVQQLQGKQHTKPSIRNALRGKEGNYKNTPSHLLEMH
jgi:hypothetical protein